MELFSLKGKTAIVTGACGLIGKEHCRALAEAGANVVVADVNQDACDAFAATLSVLADPTSDRLPKERSAHGNHMGLAINVTDKSSLEAGRDKIMAKYGSIDVLINNAAINDMFENPAMAATQSMFENYPIDMWQKSLDVNVTGVFLCSQVFGTVMAAQGKGSIINVASTYGIVGPDQSIYQNAKGEQTFYKSPAYPATKGAVVNFTRFLAAYWGEKGVRVNTLSPGGVENSQDEFFVQNYSKKTALKRMAVPTDYKGAVVFLSSDASAYMTGANLIVDGGWTAM
jgi:NAD(P)-dependent dehydrogenase (short-subunit alcohol dehydrogenase family)